MGVRYWLRIGPSHKPVGGWREINYYEFMAIPSRLRTPGRVLGWMQATRTMGGIPR